MMEIIERELVYLIYYAEIGLRNILFYYLLGISIGSFFSVFLIKGLGGF